MILTLSWLKDHLKTTASINQIIEKLTDIGLEVEGVSEGSEENSTFKIAKIIKSEKHPNADKLKLCEVSIGERNILKLFAVHKMQKRFNNCLRSARCCNT